MVLSLLLELAVGGPRGPFRIVRAAQAPKAANYFRLRARFSFLSRFPERSWRRPRQHGVRPGSGFCGAKETQGFSFSKRNIQTDLRPDPTRLAFPSQREDCVLSPGRSEFPFSAAGEQDADKDRRVPHWISAGRE
jgi:hypothetical protein